MSSPDLDLELEGADEQELAEARALAFVLERGKLPPEGRDALPGDALEAAAFLRHNRAPEISKAAEQRILNELIEIYEKRPVAAPVRRAPFRWFFWLMPAVAVSGVWLLLQQQRPSFLASNEQSAPMGAVASGREKQQLDRRLLEAQAELIHAATSTSSPRLRGALKAARDLLFRQASGPAGVLDGLRESHRQLDTATDAEAKQRAAGALSKQLDTLGASRGRSAATDQLLEDGYFRLAELAQGEGRSEAAVAYADHGLSISKNASVSRANLFLVKARAQATLGLSQPSAESLMEALSLNELLLKQTLP